MKNVSEESGIKISRAKAEYMDLIAEEEKWKWKLNSWIFWDHPLKKSLENERFKIRMLVCWIRAQL